MEQPFGGRRERAERATIQSAQHPWLKRMGAIMAGVVTEACVLEGDRLIDDAREGKVEFEVVLVSKEREDRALELERAGLPVQRIDGDLLARKSGLKNSPGIAAIARLPRARTIAELSVNPRTLLLVVAGVGDPGNLGALARSAEAAGASAMVVIDGSANPWSDKALRGSMGSLLRIPIARCATASEASSALRARRFRLIAAATRDGVPSSRFDWSGPIALWIGPETGADPREMSGFERVTIAMAGKVESLNVTVAASLLLFAAGRAEEKRP